MRKHVFQQVHCELTLADWSRSREDYLQKLQMGLNESVSPIFTNGQAENERGAVVVESSSPANYKQRQAVANTP